MNLSRSSTEANRTFQSVSLLQPRPFFSIITDSCLFEQSSGSQSGIARVPSRHRWASRVGWGGVDRARVAGIEQAEARDTAEPSVRHRTASVAAKEDPVPMCSVQRLANPGGFTGNLQVISDLTSKAMGVIFKGPADQKQNRYLGHTDKDFF